MNIIKTLKNTFQILEIIIYIIIILLVTYGLYNFIHVYINHSYYVAFYKSRLILAQAISLSLTLLLLIIVLKIFTDLNNNINIKHLISIIILISLKLLISYLLSKDIKEYEKTKHYTEN